MGDLARGLAVEMTKTDVKLFAAIVGACKGIEGSKTVSKIQSQARFGCGRQALRVIDTIFRHEAEHLAVKATAQIANLECRDMNGLENYLATFRKFRHHMGPDRYSLTDAMGCEFLRKQLAGVSQLKAIFAAVKLQDEPSVERALQLLDRAAVEHRVDHVKDTPDKGLAASDKGNSKGTGTGARSGR